MTLDTLHKFCSNELLETIKANIDRKVEAIALDKKIAESAIVATQVKYLQRAKTKLPSYFAATCVLPPLSFEQASSERVAAAKTIAGDSILDLTCGLGVDSLHFASTFKRVVAIERDEVLAEVARENFRRMGVNNIEVVCTSAEEYLKNCTEEFDWIYADPDRRSATGQKLVLLEECSPNILALMDDVKRISKGNLMIKNSPIFDVDECFRLFSPAHVEVISLGDECKEVLVSTAECDSLTATAIGRGSFSIKRELNEQVFSHKQFSPETYRYLILPDVALQKSRTLSSALKDQCDIWSNNGFGFAKEQIESPLVRQFEIENIVDYSPKSLKRAISGRKVELLKRDFPYSTRQIIEQLKIKEGGECRIAFTRVQERNIAIFLR